MARKRVTYRPSKTAGIFGVLWGAVFVVIGLVDVYKRQTYDHDTTDQCVIQDNAQRNQPQQTLQHPQDQFHNTTSRVALYHSLILFEHY